MTGRFLIFGHRGSPKRHPENTLASFDEALRAGADGFETDLRLLSDRVPVLFHDDELGGEEIETLTSIQCDARGAKLARVTDLARYAGKTNMILEVKRSMWEEVLIDLVRDWPGIVLASFDHSFLVEIRKHDPSIPLGITLSGRLSDPGPYAHRLGATWCYPNHRYVDEGMVAALHEHDVQVVPWTPNRERDWERLREIGCDGVITDVPEEAVAWRAQNAF